jgi:hypothetical protein
MKARLWQKPSSIPSTNASTPVSPSTNNGGAASPPPQPIPQQQQQQPIQTYQNSTFVPQQQQAPPPPPPQYSSHPQQQQFNQAQAPQQHAPVYMQATANTHPNQSSILGNIQQQTNNYRHPIHQSVALPPQHVAQFQTTPQTQHQTSMEHPQVLQQHLRMSYSNYGGNAPFDRAAWAAATHPQSVQTTQPTLSFATQAQQANMASYPTSIHQQPQFITANVSLTLNRQKQINQRVLTVSVVNI